MYRYLCFLLICLGACKFWRDDGAEQHIIKHTHTHSRRFTSFFAHAISCFSQAHTPVRCACILAFFWACVHTCRRCRAGSGVITEQNSIIKHAYNTHTHTQAATQHNKRHMHEGSQARQLTHGISCFPQAHTSVRCVCILASS